MNLSAALFSFVSCCYFKVFAELPVSIGTRIGVYLNQSVESSGVAFVKGAKVRC